MGLTSHLHQSDGSASVVWRTPTYWNEVEPKTLVRVRFHDGYRLGTVTHRGTRRCGVELTGDHRGFLMIHELEQLQIREVMRR